MYNNRNNYNDEYNYFNKYFDDDFTRTTRRSTTRKSGKSVFSNNRGRKGLKWALLNFLGNKISLCIIALVAVVLIIVLVKNSSDKNEKVVPTTVATEPMTSENINNYQIAGVPLVPQDEFLACCETYACTMLLQYYDFDLTVSEFVNNYLVSKPVGYGEDGNLYGPDLNCAFGGDFYHGYGVNAPGMAKFMNNYMKDKNSSLKAYPIVGQSLESLCEEYIKNDIPVMVWATTYMQEPYVKATWIVNYVDENADTEIGDTTQWQMHEHCMVLIGFDEENYYFCDSVAGKVTAYDRKTSEERYEQIGTQAIIVK